MDRQDATELPQETFLNKVGGIGEEPGALSP